MWCQATRCLSWLTNVTFTRKNILKNRWNIPQEKQVEDDAITTKVKVGAEGKHPSPCFMCHFQTPPCLGFLFKLLKSPGRLKSLCVPFPSG